MTFGDRLVTARKRKDLEQKQLAEMLGVTPTRLNYWEKNKRQPDVPMIKRLSETLDVSSDYLIGSESAVSAESVLSDEARLFAQRYDKLAKDGQDVLNVLIDYLEKQST